MIRSPLMTIMTDAVMKAARSLKRDFGEVENLQVSRKGPGDFVSAADRKAEAILRGAAEGAARLRSYHGGKRGHRGAGQEPPVACGPARRNHELPSRTAAVLHLGRAGAGR